MAKKKSKAKAKAPKERVRRLKDKELVESYVHTDMFLVVSPPKKGDVTYLRHPWPSHIHIIKLSLNYVDDKCEHGELLAEFSRSWCIDQFGLVYCNPLAIECLRAHLEHNGLSPEISYSDQGMQAADAISLDVGPEFIESWRKHPLVRPNVEGKEE